jgi:hypothetical protein
MRLEKNVQLVEDDNGIITITSDVMWIDEAYITQFINDFIENEAGGFPNCIIPSEMARAFIKLLEDE